MQTLQARIADGSVRVGVIGAGYVGLPFAVESAGAGLQTVAFDIAEDKVAQINAGQSYIGDVPSERLRPLVEAGTLRASMDFAALRDTDAVIICVPTPLNKTKDPDISAIMAAAEALRPNLRSGHLVVLESTTYPGFTREVLCEYLERGGLRAGKDFALAFSPERVDPGNPHHHTHNTPKVLGGMTDDCTRVATALYSHFIQTVVPVSSCDAAEMVKLLENTFRAVNIGLVNEVALMCHRLKLDTWEVIDAAATKPFGFMPFYPGPGLGGHCIPVDPHYLSWKLKTLNYNARFIELAGVINSGMPDVAVQMVADALNERCKAVKGSRILVLGVAYKRDIEDVRESPALDIIELLLKRGADLAYHDPYATRVRVDGASLESVALDGIEAYDCVVIVTDHSNIDYRQVCEQAQLVVDTRNATKTIRRDYPTKVVTL